jgi:hypothetical protein
MDVHINVGCNNLFTCGTAAAEAVFNAVCVLQCKLQLLE